MTFKVGLNYDKVIEIFGDKIYNSDGGAFREQVVNGLSHGCMQYHKIHGYTDDVFLRVIFDHMLRKVVIFDNGMGMPEERFINTFAAFGNSFNQDGTRSGQHGLGAMSFLRFSSSTLVESWSRETEEHYCYSIEDGKDIQPAANRLMSEYGTRIEITLKQSVRISELRNTVQNIAKHYPVKIVLTELNTEGSRSTNTALESYGRVTESVDDSSIVYNAVETMQDYVTANKPNNPFKIESTHEHVEIWINRCNDRTTLDLTLCRVPIIPRRNLSELTNNIEREIFYTLQRTFDITVDISDERGDFRPEHHRDELELVSADKLISVINESIIKFIGTIDISTTDEYKNNQYTWVVEGAGIDEYLRVNTRDTKHYLESTYEYRDGDGKHKEKTTLKKLLEYDYIFASDTMVKQTYISFVNSGLFEGSMVFAYPYYTTDDAGYYKRFISEYEDVKAAKQRLQINSLKRNKRDIKIMVHYLDHSRHTSLEDIENDENIYIDNDSGVKFCDIVGHNREYVTGVFNDLYPEQEIKYGVVLSKAHIKKIERPTLSMYALANTIIKKKRDVLVAGELRSTSIHDIRKTFIAPDYTKEALTSIVNLTKTSDSFAFVTRDEYEILVLLRGGLSNIDIQTDTFSHYFNDIENNFPDVELTIQQLVKIVKSLGYNQEKIRLVRMLASTINYASGKKILDTVITETVKFVNMLFRISPKNRKQWINSTVVMAHLESKTCAEIKTNIYNYDEFVGLIQNYLDTMKQPEEILADDTSKLKFDGYTIVGDDVIFFTHDEIACTDVYYNIRRVLGEYTRIVPSIIDSKPAVTVTVPIASRCPSYKSK